MYVYLLFSICHLLLDNNLYSNHGILQPNIKNKVEIYSIHCLKKLGTGCD